MLNQRNYDGRHCFLQNQMYIQSHVAHCRAVEHADEFRAKAPGAEGGGWAPRKNNLPSYVRPAPFHLRTYGAVMSCNRITEVS